MPFDPFLVTVSFMLLSLLVIFRAADLIVLGISNYAKRLGLSDCITGLVVVAMAASMPEVISSLTGLIAGKEDVLFGTMFGTNMVHVALLTGTIAVIGKKLDVESTILSKALVPLWFVLLVPFGLMLWDGHLGRVDGAILVSLFMIYLVWIWRQESRTGLMKSSVRVSRLWRDSFIFLGSLIALLIAGNTLVFSSVQFAALIGIPGYFIALTVLGVGGALPDFAVGLRSVKQGHQDIGMGDVLGSIVIEFLLFFGLVGLIHPIDVPVGEIFTTVCFLIVSITYLLHVVRSKVMTWRHGIVMLMLYASFLTVEIVKAFRA